MNVFDFIAGWSDIEIIGYNGEEILNAAGRANIDVWDIFRFGEKRLRFKVRLGSEKALTQAVKNPECIRIVAVNGLLPWFIAHKFRAGFAVGFAVFITALILMLSLVWSVEITGLHAIQYEDFRDALAEEGLCEGALTFGHDYKLIRLSLMQRYEQLSYVSFFMNGSSLFVEVTEADIPPDRSDAVIPCNIVAATDGVLTVCETYQGSCKVKTGMAVKKGQLLVSGVYPSKVIGYRLVRSDAKMLAYTRRTFTVYCPFLFVKKSETGNISYKYTIRLFDMSFEIPFTGTDSYELYDINSETVYLTAGKAVLPVGITKDELRELSPDAVQLSEDEAKQTALLQAEELMRFSLRNARLVSSRVEYSETEDGILCTIDCTVEEDITQKRDIIKEKK